MSEKRPFGDASDEQQTQWQREARLQYDPTLVNESIQRWNRYSKQEQEAIKQEGNRIYEDIAAAMEAGHTATSQEVQRLLKRWHEHLRYFYEPSIDTLKGLGEMYSSDPRFRENFEAVHPRLADFLTESITEYADMLETEAIARLLAEDEDDDAQQQTMG